MIETFRSMDFVNNRTPSTRRARRLSLNRQMVFLRKLDRQHEEGLPDSRACAQPKRRRGQMNIEDRFVKAGKELIRPRRHGSDIVLPRPSRKMPRWLQRSVIEFLRWKQGQREKQLTLAA